MAILGRRGSTEEETVQVAPGQAARDASDLRAAPEPLPAVRLAEAAAPDVPDVQDVRRPRDRASSNADALNCRVSTGHFRRTRRQSPRVLKAASQAMPWRTPTP